MNEMCLFVMNQKGFGVLDALLSKRRDRTISCVVGARDANVQHDFYDEIKAACAQHQIPFLDRADAKGPVDYAIAVGWRWMIRDCPRLIVFHDSLLPRYRGFAPLPTALMNGDREIGITALFGAKEYDSGDIIAQRKLSIQYPAKIQDVIDRLVPLYAELACELVDAILSGSPLPACPQDEAAATYSPWRDTDDYYIDWSRDAVGIKRFIDAVGYPYRGAYSSLDGTPAKIVDAVVEPDVKIEQRAAGKVMFVRDGLPVVACGIGMLRVLDLRNGDGTESLLPLRKFRSRFR